MLHPYPSSPRGGHGCAFDLFYGGNAGGVACTVVAGALFMAPGVSPSCSDGLGIELSFHAPGMKSAGLMRSGGSRFRKKLGSEGHRGRGLEALHRTRRGGSLFPARRDRRRGYRWHGTAVKTSGYKATSRSNARTSVGGTIVERKRRSAIAAHPSPPPFSDVCRVGDHANDASPLDFDWIPKMGPSATLATWRGEAVER